MSTELKGAIAACGVLCAAIGTGLLYGVGWTLVVVGAGAVLVVWRSR